jgi:predicted nucleotidyltransferase
MFDSIRYDPVALKAACEDLGLQLVLAFGSRAGGNLAPSESSDLDLAVLDPEPVGWERFADVRSRLSRVFDFVEVDLVFLKDVDPLFRYEIFRTAEPLFGDLDLYASQKAYAYKAYVDSADLRRLERVLFKKKLALIDRSLHASS